MSKYLYIVAGNHRQAQWLARDLQLAPNQWVYLYHKDQLRGIRGCLYTTTWDDPVTCMDEYLRITNARFVKHLELQQIVQAQTVTPLIQGKL